MPGNPDRIFRRKLLTPHDEEGLRETGDGDHKTLDTTLCSKCASISAEELLAPPLYEYSDFAAYTTAANKTCWYGPTLEAALAGQASCRLCEAICDSIHLSEDTQGDLERRTVLRLVTSVGVASDGSTPWDVEDPAKHSPFWEADIPGFSEASDSQKQLDLIRGIGVAGLGVDIESAPGSGEFPEAAAHGFKVKCSSGMHAIALSASPVLH